MTLEEEIRMGEFSFEKSTEEITNEWVWKKKNADEQIDCVMVLHLAILFGKTLLKHPQMGEFWYFRCTFGVYVAFVDQLLTRIENSLKKSIAKVYQTLFVPKVRMWVNIVFMWDTVTTDESGLV